MLAFELSLLSATTWALRRTLRSLYMRFPRLNLSASSDTLYTIWFSAIASNPSGVDTDL
jgi:hypothetical protein